MHRYLHLYIFLFIYLASCSKPLSDPAFYSSNNDQKLISRVKSEIQDLEKQTGKRFTGNSIKIHKPIKAKYSDWRGMPVGRIRGNFQGGLTSWKLLDQRASIYLAHNNKKIPDWLIRHECLHAILLSNNIIGHPKKYVKHFSKAYYWTEETEWVPNKIVTSGDREVLNASCSICKNVVIR